MAGIYLHIPFCRTRCAYCDFFSTTEGSEWKERYINALCMELETRKGYLKEEGIETIYFGGGTPSLLNIKDFKVIFDAIQSIYGMQKCHEVTLEANPDDLTQEYAEELIKLPFNRISIGIQTFNEDILRLLKRRHSAKQAVRAVMNCRKAGFKNISIDLMYGLPGETAEIWDKDLKQAIALEVEHISAYHLSYEKGTPLWKMQKEDKVKEQSQEASLGFFTTMTEQLNHAGFIQYEISNFCRPELFSKHNSSYWTGKTYLGCGPSAHSYNGINRQWNISSLPAYIIAIENNSPSIEIEELDLYTRYNDYIITSLRTMWGLSLSQLQHEFGIQLYEYCTKNAEKYLNLGLLKIIDNKLSFTEKGVFISDGVMSELLWVE